MYNRASGHVESRLGCSLGGESDILIYDADMTLGSGPSNGERTGTNGWVTIRTNVGGVASTTTPTAGGGIAGDIEVNFQVTSVANVSGDAYYLDAHSLFSGYFRVVQVNNATIAPDPY